MIGLGKWVLIIALGLLLALGVGGALKYEDKLKELIDEVTS